MDQKREQLYMYMFKKLLETFSDSVIDEKIFQLRELSIVEKEMFGMGVFQKEAFGSITRHSNERKRRRYSHIFFSSDYMLGFIFKDIWCAK